MTVEDAGGYFQEEATEVWKAEDLNSKFAKTAYTSLGEQQKAPLTQDNGAGDACLSDCLERTVVGVLNAISSLSIIVVCIHALDLAPCRGVEKALGDM